LWWHGLSAAVIAFATAWTAIGHIPDTYAASCIVLGAAIAFVKGVGSYTADPNAGGVK
jgi:hypothetical protein